ncbi:hypothetical protein QFC22_001925 [Naganishia vaughanmartiniae]|uniref:Uncharacterized protein n=1 Tax=Naganishia vaughanmartiniae TaxID=1424756 RepID=A0ACC2XF13_9TREE|nr:hypothetical protein QFC22_001925 [Naganishia vaughanmartiniae]
MPPPASSKLVEHLSQYRYNAPDRVRRSDSPLLAISPKREQDDDVSQSSTPKRKRQVLSPSGDFPIIPRSVTPKTKKNRVYADPETYAHLKAVPDMLQPGLSVVFCGINPSITSSKKQAPYSHPSNRFWKALHGGGFTDRLYDPQECIWLPERFNIGMTNLVSRPTAEQAELSAKEMRRGSLALVQKIIQHRPRVVCFVGKKIWDEFEFVIKRSAKPATTPWVDLNLNAKQGKPDSWTSMSHANHERLALRPKAIRPPFQWDQPRPYKVVHRSGENACENTLFWVVPSTSGLVRVQLPEQIEHFAALRRTIAAVQNDEIPYDMFKEVDPEGVAATVALIPE